LQGHSLHIEHNDEDESLVIACIHGACPRQ
jgi:hypothetical protein